MGKEKKVDRKSYNSRYYTEINEGWGEFRKGKLSRRLEKAISLASSDYSGKSVLDIGCGRGELCRFLASRGARCVGIDYSGAAIRIAKLSKAKNASFKKMDCTKMAFPNESFDIVFMLDIVEHLAPKELEATIEKARMILKPAGTLLIHTMPNAFLAKPFYLACRLTGTRRGINEKVHINEQTVFSLKRLLKGFSTKTCLAHEKNYFKDTAFYAKHRGAVYPLISLFLLHDFSKIPLLNRFLAAEIYVVARKKDSSRRSGSFSAEELKSRSS